MAKSCGPLRKGRAVDGKLKSNLQWPKYKRQLFTECHTKTSVLSLMLRIKFDHLSAIIPTATWLEYCI